MSEHSEVELETMERWTLARARQELSPPAATVARIQVGLGTQLGLGEAWDSASAPPHSPEAPVRTGPPERSGGRTGLIGRALPGPVRGAIVTGLGGLALGLVLGLNIASRGRANSSFEGQAAVPDKATFGQTVDPAERAVSSAPTPPPTSTDDIRKSSAERPPGPALRRERPRSKADNNQIPVPEEPPLYQEISYLSRAQKAMKAGNFEQSLGLMIELRTLSPGGSLLSEREVTEVLSLCALGQTAAAHEVASRLRARDKKLVYESRINSSCVGRKTSISSDNESPRGTGSVVPSGRNEP